MAWSHDAMPTGNLTAQSNNTVAYRRYVGGFGQPDGFGGMLKVRINRSGRLELSVFSRTDQDSKIESLTVSLTNEQRRDLARLLAAYEPIVMEDIEDDPCFKIKTEG